MKEYKPQLFKLEDAINFHKEFAQPEMTNNLEGFLQVRFSLDMTTKKKVYFSFFKVKIYLNNTLICYYRY